MTEFILNILKHTHYYRLPGISEALSDITDLIENRLEERIAVGKERFDAIETNIDEALAEVKPLVQAELSKFGGDLTSYNNKFRAGIRNLELPSPEPMPELANDVFQYIYYTGEEIIDNSIQSIMLLSVSGLGMSGAVLLILLFYILGLFYGMCGSTPSEVYTGECCDRSTGANMIAAASYLTFLLSTPLLILTTAHFIIGE